MTSGLYTHVDTHAHKCTDIHTHEYMHNDTVFILSDDESDHFNLFQESSTIYSRLLNVFSLGNCAGEGKQIKALAAKPEEWDPHGA